MQGGEVLRTLTTLSLLLSLGGCASTGRSVGGGNPFTNSEDRPQTIRVEVQNLNFADARLHAIRNGQRILMGTVVGKDDATFTVSWEFSQSLRIEINLLAGPSCTTEVLQVDAGDILRLQIASVFTSSMFCR